MGHEVAHLERIFVADAGGGRMRSIDRVLAVPEGLDGDRYALGAGHWSGRGSDPVTLVEGEVIDDLLALGVPLPPGSLRRNLVVRNLPLDALIGRRFRVGETVLSGIRPCDPCRYLGGLVGWPGLKEALEGRGGLRASVVAGGWLHVGDVVGLLDA